MRVRVLVALCLLFLIACPKKNKDRPDLVERTRQSQVEELINQDEDEFDDIPENDTGE